MKFILVLFLGLAGVILLSNWSPFNAGSLYFVIDGYRISVDLGFFAFLIIFVFFLFYFFLNLINLFLNIFQYRIFRLREKASHNLSLGLIYKGLGDLKKAEKLFLKKATHGELPEAHFIAAAEVAHQRNDNQSRDNYLEKAFGVSVSKKLPIAIIKKFEWMIEEGELESAKQTLNILPSKVKKLKKMLVLQKTLYEKTGDYDKILGLLPELKRTDEFSNNYLKQLELSCAINVLMGVCSTDCSGLRERWLSFSKNIRQKPPIIAVYTKSLLKNGAIGEAEKLLKRSIDESMDFQLLEIYGSISSEKPKRMLRAIQYWVKKYGECSELEMAAAQQCIYATMWGKAKNHLLKVIDNSPSPGALKLIADVEEQLGNHGVSLVRRRQGLELAAKEAE